jgi:hypothetical protein
MSSFNRHRKNATSGRKHADGGPTAAKIAWLLWGGSAGIDWARRIMQTKTKAIVTTKPFVSKRQQRWAYATGQPFADEWSEETGSTEDFRNLPERKRKSRSALRRQEKGKQKITGNLCRLEGGLFGSCDGSDGKVVSNPDGSKPDEAPEAAKPEAPDVPDTMPEDATEALKALGLDPKLADALGEYYSGLNADPPEEMSLNRESAAALEELGLLRVRPDQEGSNVAVDLTQRGERLQGAVQKGDIAKAMKHIETSHNVAAKKKERRERREAKKKKNTGTGSTGGGEADGTDGSKKKDEPKKSGGGSGGSRDDASDKRKQAILQNIRDILARNLTKSSKASTPGGFAVYKTSSGLRWIAFSSNAYGPDKDGHTVSRKALAADVERTEKTGLYGPLRFWHLGTPNESAIFDILTNEKRDTVKPWGEGVDLGMCDFAAMHDALLVESGTFKSEAIGKAFARKAHTLAPSIGFLHPRTQPDKDGVFHVIWRFERSAAPIDRVTNPLTRFATTEGLMNATQLKALVELLDGVPEAEVQALLDNAGKTTEKAANELGLTVKATEPEKVFHLDGEPVVIRDGMVVRLKAEEEVEAEAEVVEAAEPEAEDDREYIGDLSPDEFKTFMADALAEAIAPLVEQMKMAERMEGMTKKLADEMKALAAGTQSKADTATVDGLQAQIGDLQALKTALEQQLSEQPSSVRSGVQVDMEPVDASHTQKATEGDGQHRPASPFDRVGSWLRGNTIEEPQGA